MRKGIHGALTLLLCMLVAEGISAQNLLNGISYPYNNQYYSNQLLYNPGFAGEWDQPHFGLVAYADTSSYQHDRQAYDLHYNRPLDKYRFNFGLLFSYHSYERRNTRANKKSQFKIGLAHNWEFPFGEQSLIKIGATVSLLHFEDAEVPFVSPTGPSQSWLATNERYFKPNVDIGFLLNSGIFFLGAGLHHVNQPSFSFWQDQVSGTKRSDNFRQELFLTSGVKMKFNAMKVEPSIMLQQEGREFLLDAATVVKYEDIAFLAVNWKTSSKRVTSQQDSLVNTSQVTHPWGLTAGGRVLDKIQASVSYMVGGTAQNNVTTIKYEPFIEVNLAYFIRPNAVVTEETLE